MQLSSCKKTYNNETQRASPLEATLARIEPLVPAAGITRVADITSLDRIGIPVFSCIRPTAMDGAITVYNGKGATIEESRISAIMEGIERYSSEMHDRRPELAPYGEMRMRGKNVLDPADLILPEGADTRTAHALDGRLGYRQRPAGHGPFPCGLPPAPSQLPRAVPHQYQRACLRETRSRRQSSMPSRK